jgi:hypothetical protein
MNRERARLPLFSKADHSSLKLLSHFAVSILALAQVFPVTRRAATKKTQLPDFLLPAGRPALACSPFNKSIAETAICSGD